MISFYWINGVSLGVELVRFEDGSVLAIDLLILRVMFDF